jgi:hypothetical protein
MFRKQRYETNDSDRFPLWAMWLQIRTALAELLVPVLAGWKTLWLVLVTPKTFFEAYCFHTKPIENLYTPFDPLWRGVSAEERKPLEPAQFVLFGIVMAALAGFKFDNSNQLGGLLSRINEVYGVWNNLAQRPDNLGNLARQVNEVLASPYFVWAQQFSDQEILSAVWELIVTLFVLVFFAYLFRLVAGWRSISSANSYIFWLYMAGGQFVTTAVSTLFFSVVSLSALGLPEIAPDVFFWVLEMGLALGWQLFLPAWVLPRLFPGLTIKSVVWGVIIGRVLLKALGWLIGGGVLLTLLLTA